VRLPSDSTIDPRKISDYLLRPRQEDDKSGFLARAGYTSESGARLLTDLRDQILVLDAEAVGPSEYGMKYRIRGALTGPNGKTLRVVSIWVTLKRTSETRFVTLYPEQP
jgi:hypothetical protein